MNVGQYVAPAHFTVTEESGNTVIHAPVNSAFTMTTTPDLTLTTMSSSFLENGEASEEATSEQETTQATEEVDIEKAVDNEISSYYSFLQ
jgi:hypothetical protein